MNTVKRSIAIVAAAATLSAGTVSLGKFVGKGRGSSVPVVRLIDNVSKYISENPDDSEGHCVLARLHAMAFVLGSRTVRVEEHPRRQDGRLLPWIRRHRRWEKGAPNPPFDHEELIAHLTGSVRYYEEAIKKWVPSTVQFHNPAFYGGPILTNPRYYLGLAYVLEKGADFAGEVAILPSLTLDDPTFDPLTKRAKQSPHDSTLERLAEDAIMGLGGEDEAARNRTIERFRMNIREVAGVLHRNRDHAHARVRDGVRSLLGFYWRELAIVHYFISFEQPAGRDLRRGTRPRGGVEYLTSYEAGESYRRLVLARGTLNDVEAQRVRAVSTTLEKLEGLPKPRASRTPIIFSVDRPTTLDELLAKETTVDFDLDGDGLVQRWPWVKPSTAFLVWDPTDSGKITSGRQLFGSATWWMFFRDGYHAMDALDDDRNGRLEGAELAGLAAWFDQDSDGVSDPGEVLPLAILGVCWLATTATDQAGMSPTNPTGLGLKDGRVLPTYDWVTMPVPPRREASHGAYAVSTK